MSFRSFSSAAIIAAALGTVAAPAMARTVHVMGLTVQQPDYASRDEVVTTGSVSARHDIHGVYDGRAARRPAANQ